LPECPHLGTHIALNTSGYTFINMDFLTPVLAVVPCQLLAYYCVRFLERETDKPRNLAKSVTVE